MRAVLTLALAGCSNTSAAPPVVDVRTPEQPGACCAPPAPRVRVVSPLSAAVKSGWAPDFTGHAGSSRGCLRSTAAGRFALPLDLDEGDRMLSLAVSAIGIGDVPMQVTSFSAAPDGSLALATVGSLDAYVPAAWTNYDVDLVDTTVRDGVSYWLEVSTLGGGLCVGAFRLTYDRED